MSEFKVIYFNARGRAEPSRLCFAFGGVKYEDVRLSFEEWGQKKKEGYTLNGFLPMMEVNGEKLSESLAMMRFAARKSGLCPSDDFKIAQCDMVVDMIGDMNAKLVAFVFTEKDEGKKKTLMEEFNATHLPNFLKRATDILQKNGNKYFVGNEWSYADIMMYYFTDNAMVKKALDDFPAIKEHHNSVEEIPRIKAWLAERPATEF